MRHMSGRRYKSTGTVRVRFKGSVPKKLFFTPNSDSIVRRNGTRYAVFLSEDRDGNPRSLARKMSDDSDVEIGINDGSFCDLVPAATQSTLVEIEVKDKGKLKLRAATIPAPPKGK